MLTLSLVVLIAGFNAAVIVVCAGILLRAGYKSWKKLLEA
jgi:hypothetical protein